MSSIYKKIGELVSVRFGDDMVVVNTTSTNEMFKFVMPRELGLHPEIYRKGT